MITLVAGIVGAVVLGGLMSLVGLDGFVLTPIFAIVGFIAATVPVNLRVKKKLEAIFNGLQADTVVG